MWILRLTLILGGAMIGGSFAVCVADRYVTNQSLWDRSRCDQCHHPLSWWQLLPILGFFLQHGHCHWCHHPLSWRFPVSELFCALLALGGTLWLKFPPTEFIILITWLTILTLEDHATRTVHPYALWGGALILTCFNLHQCWINLYHTWILLLLSLGGLGILVLKKQLGSADLILISLWALRYGIYFTWEVVLIAAFITLFYIIDKHTTQPVPFIPFLVCALGIGFCLLK
ncbi:prepilin peptidase [Ligilactobacillus sp. LYQ139]|uniref:prepilin peptidase n=2 Tax=unclassified Ligilactobacillus TaxID=2767920 RepID=UPI0038538CD1